MKNLWKIIFHCYIFFFFVSLLLYPRYVNINVFRKDLNEMCCISRVFFFTIDYQGLQLLHGTLNSLINISLRILTYDTEAVFGQLKSISFRLKYILWILFNIIL